MSTPALAATCTWTGAANDGGLWLTPANWNCGAAGLQANDNVIIDSTNFPGGVFSSPGFAPVNDVTLLGVNPITIGGGIINFAGEIKNDSLDATINTHLVGTGHIAQNSGALSLGDFNNFSGGSTVLNGFLIVTQDQGLGTGDVVVAKGGQLAFSGVNGNFPNNITLEGSNPGFPALAVENGVITLSGNIQFDAGQSGNTVLYTDLVGAFLVMSGNVSIPGFDESITLQGNVLFSFGIITDGKIHLDPSTNLVVNGMTYNFVEKIISNGNSKISGFNAIPGVNLAAGGVFSPGSDGTPIGSFGQGAVFANGDSLTLSNLSTYEQDIGGTALGGYDQFVTSATPTIKLNGANLVINFVNGYVPQIGDEFHIMSTTAFGGPSSEGQFSYDGQLLLDGQQFPLVNGNGIALQIDYNKIPAGDVKKPVSLKVVAVPKVNPMFTLLTIDPAGSANLGEMVAFTADVISGIPGNPVPTGNVDFKNGGQVIGSAVLVGGKASLLKADLPPGTYNVTAEYSGDAVYNPSASNTIFNYKILASDLAVTQTIDNANPKQGMAVKYTVTVTNNGPDLATNFTVQDTFPFDMLVTGVAGAGCSAVGNAVTFNSANLALNTSVSCEIDAVVLNVAGAFISNKADITLVSPGDHVPENNSATLSFIVDETAPVAGNDNYNVTQGVPFSANLLDNDGDVDGNLLLLDDSMILNGPTNGVLVLNDDAGNFTYTADAGYTGEDSFQYTVLGGALVSNLATVTFNVNAAVADTSFSFDLDSNSIDEDGTVNLTGMTQAPLAGDDFTIVINWGDGSAPQVINFLPVGAFGPISHKYVDNKPVAGPQEYTISVDAEDVSSGTVLPTQMKNITVNNVSPILGVINVSPNVQAGVAMSLDGTFADPGTLDDFVVDINWGDGSAVTNLQINQADPKTFIAGHTFAVANLFQVEVKITDKDGGVAVQNVPVGVAPGPNPPTGDVIVTAVSDVNKVFPGGTVHYTFAITNNSDFDLNNLPFFAFPTNLDAQYGNWTCTILPNDGQCSTLNGNGAINTTVSLKAHTSGVFNLAATIVNNPVGNTYNAATGIAIPLGFTDTNANNNQAAVSIDIFKGIAGRVYVDSNNNNVFDAGETMISGVEITLKDLNEAVLSVTQTGIDGVYFLAAVPGEYSVVETQPNGYGSVSPNILNIQVPANGLQNQNFTESFGSLGGFVYNDLNENNGKDNGEAGIAGAAISLTGVDVNGKAVLLNTVTNANGAYSFANLVGGTYTIQETAQPNGFVDGPETLGTAGGNNNANDTFSAIALGGGVNATGYNFGEMAANNNNPPAGGGGGGGAGASGGGNASSGNNPVVLTPPYFGAGADGSCGNYKDIDKNDPMCKEYAVVTDLGFNGFADGSNTFGPKMIFRRAEAQKVVQVAFKASYKDAEDYCKNVNPFLDVVIGKHWAVNRLCWAKNNRTATGFTNLKKFLPEKGVTAAEFAAMILRNTELAPAQDIIYKENLAQGKPWYTGYWNYVLENKLSSLKSPNKILTRSEAVHMLYLFNEKGLLKAAVK